MQPNIWGKYFWSCMHIAALGYPNEPTFEDQVNYTAFYRTIGKVLPCKKCTVNYERHFSSLPIEPHLGDRRALFNWTVYLHNTVNKELGKALWNTDYAYSYYINLPASKNTSITDNSGNKLNQTSAIQFAMYGSLLLNAILVIVFFVIASSKR